MKQRCPWNNLDHSEIYQQYHDKEWGIASHDDKYLFEMLVLESFHCGLSWLLILKKRDAFAKAFDQFNPNIISKYRTDKINTLLENSAIVRHRGKIEATINNANSFIQIQKEFGSFDQYIWSFTQNKIVYGDSSLGVTQNKLSDTVSKDLKRRGFKFMGSVTTYSYLEAIGVMNNHSRECFMFHKKL